MRYKSFVYVFLTIVALSVASLHAGDTKHWSPQPFVAAPDEVFAAVEALDLDTEDADAVMILEEVVYRFDAQGRQRRIRSLVYRYLSELGVDDWDTVGTNWQPWHQEKPVIEARVMVPGGQVAMLDPETISEAPGGGSGEDVFDDRRYLEAPLPLAQVGAVVEERVTMNETEARFPGGTKGVFYPSWSVPTLETRLIIEVDEALELRWLAFLLDDVEPLVEEIDGGTRYTFVFYKPEKRSDIESNMPFDQPRWPHIAFSTGDSWPVIAEAYAEIVDEQIAAASADEFLPEKPAGNLSRKELVQAALDWLHDRVRYTGLEFGRSSIVPYPPDLTTSRGYGDCKDQATLLVSLLRHWSVRADVALLRSGFSFDTVPELPAIGAFNHAIVYIPGEPVLWVDPTSEYQRAGSMPSADADRYALIANRETKDLAKTPQISSEDRGIRETRELHLADEGESRLVFTVEPWGNAEVSYRNWHVSNTDEERRESMASWVESLFLAEELSDVTFTDPAALAEPYTIRVVSDKAGRGITSFSDAMVAIRYEHLISEFPKALREEKEDGEEREHDFLYPTPFQMVWKYRAVPPTGFVAADLPEARVTELGSARLEESFSLADDGAIEALISLDSGPRLITAEVFEETREALAELGQRDYTPLYFVHKGQHLLGQGRTAEGLAEMARLVEAEPEVALHQVRLAQGLITAGLGEEARAAAYRAVEIDDQSLAAHKSLAWILQHDLVGRHLGPGFDLEGAIATYRKAEELEDSDLSAAINLAILLEHDDQGVRYSPQADLDGAIATYRAAKEKYSDEFNYDHNLLVAMLWARRYQEIVELYPDLGDSDNESLVILTALAATQGVEEAHRRIRLKYRDADKVRETLFSLAQLLGQQRFYPEAGATFRLAAQGAQDVTSVLNHAFMMERSRKIEDLELDPASAEGVVNKAYVFAAQPDGDERIVGELLCSLVTKHYDEDDIEASGFNLGTVMSRVARPLNLPTRVLIDMNLGNVDFIVEGAKGNVRRVHLRNLAESQSDVVVFVIMEGESFKILASAEDLSPLGIVARGLVEEGNSDGARELLDWARDLSYSYDAGDTLAGVPFAQIWRQKAEYETPAIIKAALILASGGPLSELALPELEKIVEAEPEAEWRDQMLVALIDANLETEDYERALELADLLSEEHPDSWYPTVMKGAALVEMKRYDEAAKASQALLDKKPDDIMAMRLLSGALQMHGEVERAIDLLSKVVASSEAIPPDFNNLAWLALFRDTIDDQAFQWANAAVKRAEDGGGDYAALHTLATLYAVKDMPAEAYQVIIKAMGSYDEPRPEDWFVFGRMAETYGFQDAARKAYQRVIDGEEDDYAISTAALASRQLESMSSKAEESQ
jgi:tetratricopeptide (TPR) repeat protein/transglutaminase-like putative cysteine protease